MNAVQKRHEMYVGLDGLQANRVVEEIIQLGRNFDNVEVKIYHNIDVVITFELLKEALLKDIQEGDFPGSILFRKMALLITELTIPNYFYYGFECNPAISTALCSTMEINIPCGNNIETGQWIKGEKFKYSKRLGNGKIEIKFTPDTKFIGAEIDFDKLRDNNSDVIFNQE
jgi:hypothetical protein